MQGAGQYDPSQGLDLLQSGAESLRGATQPFDPASATDFWEKSFKAPAMETWRDEIMPSIMERGVGMGGTADSGPMRRELARSGQNLATNLSGQLSNLLYSGEQAQLGRQMQGAGMQGQMAQIPGQLAGQGQQMASLGLGQMAGMGGEQRGIGQQFLSAEQQKWQEAQPYQNPWLQYLSTALGVPSFDTVVSPQEPSIASQMAPYAMAAGTAAASDIRVKENIEPIEDALEKVQKLKGYMFDYKKGIVAEERRHGGVMAQDLEKVLPDAVTETGGIKRVDMNAVIGLLVNAVNELNERVRSN